MSNSWLHWIGGKYYTIPEFIAESHEYGITRRVSLADLKRMNFSDWVYCIQKKKNANYGSVFGRFQITGISGLNETAISAISANHRVENMGGGGRMVVRGCGFYIEGESYAVDATLPELAETLLNAKCSQFDKSIEDIKPMIKGDYLEILPEPWAVLQDVPHRQGFRLFKAEQFLKDREDVIRNGKIKLRGQYYVDKKAVGVTQEIGGDLQSVSDYRKDGNT